MRAIAAAFALLGLAVSLAACKPAGGPGAVASGDMSLGNPNAKVTVIEYASLGCPICAKWNNDIFPAFKTKYIDTGKVRYVLKEMLTGDEPVAAAGFLLARCAGKDKYFQVVDAVFAPGAGPAGIRPRRGRARSDHEDRRIRRHDRCPDRAPASATPTR